MWNHYLDNTGSTMKMLERLGVIGLQRHETGASTVEYILILAAVSVILIPVIYQMGRWLTGELELLSGYL